MRELLRMFVGGQDVGRKVRLLVPLEFVCEHCGDEGVVFTQEGRAFRDLLQLALDDRFTRLEAFARIANPDAAEKCGLIPKEIPF
jgi:hypothetical protein